VGRRLRGLIGAPRAAAAAARRSVLELIVVASIASFAVGAGLAWLPAGFMVAGALGLAGAERYVRGGGRGMG
jgi:hypothetical protein